MGPIIEQLCSIASPSQRTWRLRLRHEFVAETEAVLEACQAALSFLGIRVAVEAPGQLTLAARGSVIADEELAEKRVQLPRAAESVPLRSLGMIESMALVEFARKHDRRNTVQSILGNLDILFNADPLGSGVGLGGLPNVQSSVLNFGIAAGVGRSVSSLQPRDLEHLVAKAVRDFEPRLDPASIHVTLIPDLRDEVPGEIRMLIEGQLRPELGGDSLRVMTNIELLNGRARNRFA